MKTATRNNEGWVEAIGKPTYEAIEEMVENYQNAASDELREETEQVIMDDPLEVSVRSGWYHPGTDSGKPDEYNILLGTGGPATRIIGDLNEYGQPTTARLEVQDWFTPWTEYQDASETVLLDYVGRFYFGD